MFISHFRIYIHWVCLIVSQFWSLYRFSSKEWMLSRLPRPKRISSKTCIPPDLAIGMHQAKSLEGLKNRLIQNICYLALCVSLSLSNLWYSIPCNNPKVVSWNNFWKVIYVGIQLLLKNSNRSSFIFGF